ncbi:coiled-coil domain-containing protein 150 isoform X2 [Scophthalmus maximus]|uniref:coiled-coil domain-containing protein 150 isoform X2 n=1 Tax=Scophthalmus maximus TaxID=52904 RepID=UPI001FA92C35|nr:coiled-coil domain-containing protein 150 isoform X2 [Scophthalmus maximus]
MLWRHCDSLVSRVCRMESLLQTLKLTIFRLETERELDPPHTAHLTQQLVALRQQREEEQRACRAEVMKLREQLRQADQERDEARTDAHSLWETVEASAAAKVDVALAAEELKIVKLEMSQKITEMKEQMRQESARSNEATKSQSRLLLRAEEMEAEAELKRRQAELLQSDRRVLCAEVKTSRRQLEEERERGRRLEELCGQLEEQTATKDSLVSELKTELEAERSRVVKQVQEQDRLLTAARRNIQTELQVALAHSVSLQEELEKLKGEHAHLLQSSSTAQEMAAVQKELLERTVTRLQEELSTAQREKEAMREDLAHFKKQLCLVVTKLEGEKSSLETRLSKATREVGSLSSALQSQQGENRRLMGKVSALEQQRTDNVCFCGCVQHVDQMLRDLTEENKPAYEKLKVKLESLQKALDTVTVDKDRLAQSLQQAVLTNSKVQQNQATITLRDEELHEARTKANDLSEELSAIKRRFSEDYEFAMKKLHREISELKMTVKDSSRSSGDLSKGLHRRVSELERLASTQRVRIWEQRSQRRQEQQSRELHQDNCQKVEVSGKREVEWERWTSTIQRWEAKRQLAHVTEGLNPVRTQLETHRTHR